MSDHVLTTGGAVFRFTSHVLQRGTTHFDNLSHRFTKWESVPGPAAEPGSGIRARDIRGPQGIRASKASTWVFHLAAPGRRAEHARLRATQEIPAARRSCPGVDQNAPASWAASSMSIYGEKLYLPEHGTVHPKLGRSQRSDRSGRCSVRFRDAG
jgi:hypothetical protein